MSDYITRFIPDDPYYILNADEIRQIKSIVWRGNAVSVEVNDVILFADAGENFESVLCPLCKSDLKNNWGKIMGEAYADGYGFVNLDFITSCCNKSTSLQNLIYYFQQGFYKSIVEVIPDLQSNIDEVEICKLLMQITGITWRVIHSRL